ncbi:hypothetical protein TPHA_0A04070 [Tetrapisispora phaffii CBS 4417]|uniref:Uncharacterized protein n=1 Tax=Tetrapisispora phaffii (strain ATCC 24235 / CBS 4417 / NBRC 1672 / NRRL Y-8282 / UCD 70-5) TaxID=1071381 RepID=G8BNK5_TETPH|nr:hypothetical protein TPHA_0A04070 [Tetrapisispora phaffii CBS 4417]CCE61483.1 hypothetical protein TPHA_0A04070 [Tetrapisispora phaffii CBS 4417]
MKEKNRHKKNYELNKQSLKVWFHHIFYREEYDDRFYNDINITIDSQYDYSSLLPFYKNKNTDNELYSSDVKSSKFKQFKYKLKVKLVPKSNSEVNHSFFSDKEENSINIENSINKSSMLFNKYKITESEISNLLERTSKDHNCPFEDNIDPTLSLPFQNISYQEMCTALKNNLDITLDSFKSSSITSQTKITIESNTNSDGNKENNVDDELVKNSIEIDDNCEVKSENTNNVYLKYMQDNISNEYNYGADEVLDSDSIKEDSSEYSSSLEELSDLEISNSSNNNSDSFNESKEKILTIPTFKLPDDKDDSIRTSNVTKTKSSLEELFEEPAVSTNRKSRSCLSKRESKFSSIRSNEYCNPRTFDITELSVVNFDNINGKHIDMTEKFKKRKCNKNIALDEKNLSVKFNNNSLLFQYSRSTRNNKSKFKPYTSYSLPQLRSGNSGQVKSILKNKVNNVEEEEARRVVNCDKVNFESFLKYLDHFESQRYLSEDTLSKIREKQIHNYYSKKSVL